jgi:hypothetical protein
MLRSLNVAPQQPIMAGAAPVCPMIVKPLTERSPLTGQLTVSPGSPIAVCALALAAAFAPVGPASAQSAADSADSQSDSDLAKKLQNPIGDLISFPFQNNTNFNTGPNGGVQNVLNIQPVIPIHINADWNVITRTILPIVWNPDLSPAPSVPVGTGPTNFSAFLSPRELKNGWLWGVGPIVQIPTVSGPGMGSNIWGAGPTAVIVYSKGPWVTGVLANNVWSFGGTRGPLGNAYSSFLMQPFVNYNFGGGWYVGSSPIVTANWDTSGRKWTVPVGANAGRVFKIGKQPINVLFGAYYNLVTPQYGPDWQLRTQVTFIF